MFVYHRTATVELFIEFSMISKQYHPLLSIANTIQKRARKLYRKFSKKSPDTKQENSKSNAVEILGIQDENKNMRIQSCNHDCSAWILFYLYLILV